MLMHAAMMFATHMSDISFALSPFNFEIVTCKMFPKASQADIVNIRKLLGLDTLQRLVISNHSEVVHAQ